jgi:hypothetical protein
MLEIKNILISPFNFQLAFEVFLWPALNAYQSCVYLEDGKCYPEL